MSGQWVDARLGGLVKTIVPQRDKPTELSGPVPWLRIEDFDGKYLSTSKSSQGVTMDQVAAMPLRVFPARTVITSCSCTMGATAIAGQDVITNQTFIGLLPDEDKLSSDFLYYLMQEKADYLQSQATGAIQQYLSQDDFRRIRFRMPPLPEQNAIASFLDHETAEIDAFISDQEELIALLNERRVATITQAVTKGLDLNARMKDSGVPWIGKVPQHWVIDKGTRIGKVFGSEMIKEDDINEVAGTQFLKVSSLSIDGFSLQPTRWFVDRYTAPPMTDFLVFPKRGAAIFTNKVNIVKEPALLDPNLMGWKPYKGCDSKFFAYVLQLVKLEEIADVSTVPQINTKHIASLRLPKPSSEEQQKIVDYLDFETSEIDAAIADAKEAIDLSKERRAALISAAVTGKIDVRNRTTAELGAA